MTNDKGLIMNTLEGELEVFKQRTRKSLEALTRAVEYLPLGCGSNFRAYSPNPIFADHAHGGHLWDVDGNEYIDFGLCFGALMAGHCHPKVVAAIQSRLERGTMWGMPDELSEELAREICSRFPVEKVRFANSGTEATSHAIRLARAHTGRSKIIKMEGCYHGVHDAVLVSFKPALELAGDASHPNQVPASEGIPQAVVENTLPASFNDLIGVERLFEENAGQVAAVILEPIMMNIGIAMPDEGYLEGLQELCRKHGALLIFDEVKTGAKLSRGGACEYFRMKPDIITLAKSIGGGTSLAAFASSGEIMNTVGSGRAFHAGTYNTNPLAMAAGIATLKEVLTDDAYKHVFTLNERLMRGYAEIIEKAGVPGYVTGAGANGTLMLSDKRVRNYRDWLSIDDHRWRIYWFGMLNRGVIVQPWAWDEQWTISVAHTEEDIDRHLAAFADIAPMVAEG
jgi:glutamate-1-semialdehyde 2,1-aminomutase